MSTDYTSMNETEPELSLYWDPRYEAYFYRGAMPSPTGEETLQALYAAPAVEMLPTDEPDVDPIFVAPDEQGFRSRPSTGNRITWLLRQPPKDTEEWDVPCSVPVLAVLALALGAITLLMFVVLCEALREQREMLDSTVEDETDELGLQFVPFKVPERTRVPHVGNTTLMLPPTIGPGLQVFNDVEHAPPYLPPTMWSVCLASGSAESYVRARDNKLGFLSSPAPCCESAVVCCSAVNHDLTVQALPFKIGSQNAGTLLRHSTQCHGKSTGKKIMGVRGTEAVFSRLVDAKSSSHSLFLRSVLRSLMTYDFNGVALLLQDVPQHSNKSAVSVIRALSEALRQHGYTLKLLLPYESGHHGAYGENLRALNGVLPAPYSLLLYHEVKMLGNTTLWPSPTDVSIPTHKEDVRNGISVCHLFFKRPLLVSTSEECDPSKVQAIAEMKGQHFDDVAKACSLWSQSWKTRAYRYNTYTCAGRTGILYQTRQQARAFYQDLLTRMQSLCYGIIDWQSGDFPSVCQRDKFELNPGRASFASEG